MASIRLLAPWEAPDTPALEGQREEWARTERSEAVLAADGGSTGDG